MYLHEYVERNTVAIDMTQCNCDVAHTKHVRLLAVRKCTHWPMPQAGLVRYTKAVFLKQASAEP